MAKYGYGVDVGGTEIKFGFFSDNKEILEKWSIPTRVSDSEGKIILSDIAESINEHKKKVDGEIIGVCLDLPGPIVNDSLVVMCANLYWKNVDAGKILSEMTGLPVTCLNDANAAALGEIRTGDTANFKSAVLFTLGTGIGCSVILDGELLIGSHGTIAEIGHIPIDIRETEPHSCGKYGCLEQYASATGLSLVARRYLQSHDIETPLRALETPTSKDVWDEFKKGDKAAGEILEVYGDYLGRGLAVAANICDPEVFIIGGGMSKAGEPLLDLIRRHYVKYAYTTCLDAKFVLAKLGNDAGICGCMYRLLEKYN